MGLDLAAAAAGLDSQLPARPK